MTEYNYGGAGQLASGLALADALARFARPSMLLAAHWGALGGWLGTAFRLYRNYDGRGGRFPDADFAVETSRPESVSLRAGTQGGRLHLVAINRATEPQTLDILLDRPLPPSRLTRYGFEAGHPDVAVLGASEAVSGITLRLILPPRSAQHCVATPV